MTVASIPVQLRQIRLEAEGIFSYEFVAQEEGGLPPFTAGAHLDLNLPEGRVRSYSLANAPHDANRYLVAVQREEQGRGGSVWMHDCLRVGQVVRAAVPPNDFALDESAEHSIFIAGGIGITPVLSMIARLDALHRSWQLYYAAHSPQRTAFVAQLEALDRGRDRVVFCFSSDRAERLDIAGVVARSDAATQLYCCGPTRMIDAFCEAARGRAPSTVHFERFSAAEAPAVAGGYTVVLQKSGKRLPVAPGKTLLDTLLDENVPVPYACSNGICGTCMTQVTAGTPDHRDEFLTEEERRSGTCMMVCCSGSLTPELTLDL